MNCLVTGGSGFLGSHLSDQLSSLGFSVTIFDKKQTKWKKKNQKIIIGNLLNTNQVNKAVKNQDVIFHFAGLSDLNKALTEPKQSIMLNILGTVNLLEAAKKFKIKRFIHASSIYVNSEQGGFYRSSKRAAEDYVEEYQKRFGLNYTIIRFGSLYGERSDSTNGVKKVIEAANKSNQIVYFGSKDSVREYIHVKDAAYTCIRALNKKFKNKHLIATGSKKIKVKSFLKTLKKLFKDKKQIKFINKKKHGHYIKNPYTYKFRKGVKIKLKSQINFAEGLENLLKEMKIK